MIQSQLWLSLFPMAHLKKWRKITTFTIFLKFPFYKIYPSFPFEVFYTKFNVMRFLSLADNFTILRFFSSEVNNWIIGRGKKSWTTFPKLVDDINQTLTSYLQNPIPSHKWCRFYYLVLTMVTDYLLKYQIHNQRLPTE